MKRANVLDAAWIPVAILDSEALEEGGHGLQLVGRAFEVVREASGGEIRRDLRQVVCGSSDGGDIGTCESMGL